MKAQQAIKNNLPFINWRHNAFHLNFPNGNWLSTTFGYGSYSDNHNIDAETGVIDRFDTFYGSQTVEVMFTCGDSLKKRLHKKFDGDESIIGYLSITDWLYIVNALAKDTTPAIESRGR